MMPVALDCEGTGKARPLPRMRDVSLPSVIPAQAGIQHEHMARTDWRANSAHAWGP